MNQHERDGLEPLFSRYLDGEIDAEGLAELERSLMDDPLVAERFSEWCLTHRQVIDVMSEDRLHGLIDQYLVGGPGPPDALAKTSVVRRDDSGGWGLPTLAVLAAGVCGVSAALIMGALVAGGVFETPRSPVQIASTPAPALSPPLAARPAPGPSRGAPRVTHPEAAIRPIVGEPVAIASLTQLFEPVWATPEGVLVGGQLLAAGNRVALSSGKAKLTFDCGAEIVLEGPCDFELESRMAGVLHSGKITADVPKRAFGFGILCPRVDLVDLGTSFGVSVDTAGDTELHVFKGEVLCSPSGAEDPEQGNVIHVRANEAMTFAGGSSGGIAMDELQFASLRSVRQTLGVGPASMATDRLALWLSADKAALTDDDARVVNWPDILYGDNASAEDALQPDPEARPMLVHDAINGLPAVRFDGKTDYLLTTPLQTTDDQTVVLVCQYGAGALDEGRIWGGQIINYDGPPSRYLSDTLEPGVLQIGEPLLESQFEPTLITGQVFSGFIGATTVEAGRVDAKPVGVGRPTLVAYTYSYSTGVSELRINGRLTGTARAFAPQGVTSRKILGRHAWMDLYFNGDLAELLIYNRALTDEQLAATTAYLAGKYAIPLDDDGGDVEPPH